MTDKTLVIETLTKLPDAISLKEIREEIDLLIALRQGEDELDAGLGIPHEELERKVASRSPDLDMRQPDLVDSPARLVVADFIKRFSDEATLEEIAVEIRVLAGVRRGLSESRQGKGIPHEEFMREIQSWRVESEMACAVPTIVFEERHASECDQTGGET